MEANELFALAEDIANVLSKIPEDIMIEQDAEAELRASIAAARYTREAFGVMMASAGKSALARSFMAPAWTASYRAEQQLRRRVTRLLGAIALHLDRERLWNVVDSVLSVSA